MSLPAMKPTLLPVLLIEDEPAVMAMCKLPLSVVDIPWSAANLGVEALRLLENGSFLGVVPDMQPQAAWMEARYMPGSPATGRIWLIAWSLFRRHCQRRDRCYAAGDWRSVRGKAFSGATVY